MHGEAPAVDLAALLDRIGGDEELLRELVGIYLEDEGRLLEETARALSAGDADAMRRAAHTLKGAVSNFCAPAATAAAQALELIGRDGRTGDAPEGLEALRRELVRVREALEVFRR